MYKVLLCHQRPPHTSRQAFQRDWHSRRRHMVLNLQSDLGFHRYTQSHQVSPWNPLYQLTRASRSSAVTSLLALLDGRSPAPPGICNRPVLPRQRWDVIETLTYPSDEARTRALTSPAGLDALDRLADDHTTNTHRTRPLVADAHVPVPPPASPSARVSLLFFLHPRPDVPSDDMLAYWGTQHKSLFLSLHEALGYRGYEQLHVRTGPNARSLLGPLSPPASPSVAGVARLTYPDLRTFGLRSLTPSALAANGTLIRDEITFADLPHSALVLGREHRFSSPSPSP